MAKDKQKSNPITKVILWIINIVLIVFLVYMGIQGSWLPLVIFIGMALLFWGIGKLAEAIEE